MIYLSLAPFGCPFLFWAYSKETIQWFTLSRVLPTKKHLSPWTFKRKNIFPKGFLFPSLSLNKVFFFFFKILISKEYILFYFICFELEQRIYFILTGESDRISHTFMAHGFKTLLLLWWVKGQSSNVKMCRCARIWGDKKHFKQLR